MAGRNIGLYVGLVYKLMIFLFGYFQKLLYQEKEIQHRTKKRTKT